MIQLFVWRRGEYADCCSHINNTRLEGARKLWTKWWVCGRRMAVPRRMAKPHGAIGIILLNKLFVRGQRLSVSLHFKVVLSGRKEVREFIRKTFQRATGNQSSNTIGLTGRLIRNMKRREEVECISCWYANQTESTPRTIVRCAIECRIINLEGQVTRR